MLKKNIGEHLHGSCCIVYVPHIWSIVVDTMDRFSFITKLNHLRFLICRIRNLSIAMHCAYKNYCFVIFSLLVKVKSIDAIIFWWVYGLLCFKVRMIVRFHVRYLAKGSASSEIRVWWADCAVLFQTVFYHKGCTGAVWNIVSWCSKDFIVIFALDSRFTLIFFLYFL